MFFHPHYSTKFSIYRLKGVCRKAMDNPQRMSRRRMKLGEEKPPLTLHRRNRLILALCSFPVERQHTLRLISHKSDLAPVQGRSCLCKFSGYTRAMHAAINAKLSTLIIHYNATFLVTPFTCTRYIPLGNAIPDAWATVVWCSNAPLVL